MLYKIFSLLGLEFSSMLRYLWYLDRPLKFKQMVFPPSDPSMLLGTFFSDPSWTGALVNSVVIACVSQY